MYQTIYNKHFHITCLIFSLAQLFRTFAFQANGPLSNLSDVSTIRFSNACMYLL